ncbi:MAG: hypothetical protein ABF293_09360 [Flavobacteriaceae bacterium]
MNAHLPLRLSHLLLIIVSTLLLTCTSSSEPEEEMEEAEVVVSADLVGSWSGTVDGSLGSASANFSLEADGTMTADTNSQILCPLEGTWRLSGRSFSITAEDECDGTNISMQATASKTTLSGSWSASSGNNGTFRITKG